MLLYTSGTTARPKGVQHSHNTIRSEWEIPFLPNDGPYLNPFPAGHIAGFNFMLRPIICGVPMVYLDRWDATVAAQLVERFRVTQSGGTPYFMHSLVDAAQRGGYDLSSIRAFSLGATGVTPELVRYADRFGWGAGRSYGLTEHSTVTRCDPGMPYEKRAYTDGQLQPGTEVRIVDPDGRDLGRGEQGEILTRGPELFMGYTDSRLDADCFVDDGWFRTGDLGHLDADGYLTITDRLKDIVIRGGENISSREVENVLMQHAAGAAGRCRRVARRPLRRMCVRRNRAEGIRIADARFHRASLPRSRACLVQGAGTSGRAPGAADDGVGQGAQAAAPRGIARASMIAQESPSPPAWASAAR